MNDEHVKAFICELVEVCRKHNLSLAHEDTQGAFTVEEYQESLSDWLRCAYDNRGRKVQP